MSAALRLFLRFVWVDGDMEVVNREVVQVFCGFFVVFILRFGDGLYIFFKSSQSLCMKSYSTGSWK